MQLKTVTNARDAGILGLEFVKTDKAITEVVIGKLRIRKGESYSPGLQVVMEAPFEDAKRHRMTATIDGFDPKVSYHDDEWSARQAGNEFTAKGAEVVVEQVTVQVNDNGEVVGLVGDATPVAPSAFDQPF